MSTDKEIILRIETLVAGAITAGLLVLVTVLLGPVLALLGFFVVAMLLSILVALGPKTSAQITEPGSNSQARTQFTYR